MPWETGSTHGKYQYHPGGDAKAPPKDAPSAVNVVVVPDVNLPKVRSFGCPPSSTPFRSGGEGSCVVWQRLHDKYNKWGKDGY